jgi:Glycosyl hydrolases family 2, sugar binding domain/Glycosyl hydrolases family 2/Glycosyl hydrolases family 2, TIM barrel domain
VRQEKTSLECASCSVSRRTFIAGAGSIAALTSAPSLLEAIEHASLSPATQLHDSLGAATGDAASSGLHFSAAFSPSENFVKDVERPYRQDICLNGAWQFQPMSLPEGFVEGEDPTPSLPSPKQNHWEPEPILVPSPWNVNSFANQMGQGGDFHCYPSYPKKWEKESMGWLRRAFVVPASWKGRNVSLHFEAVAGNAEVLVNGKSVGNHFDIFLPFDLDVTNAILFGEANEVLVGVRKASLFDRKGDYGRRLYQGGSFWGQHVVGIWQDVFLVAAPPLRVSDVFVQPKFDADALQAEVRLQSDVDYAIEVSVDASAFPWISSAGTTTLTAPLPSSELAAEAALELSKMTLTVPARGSVTATLQVAVKNRLKLWTADNPHLYGLVVSVSRNGEMIDRKYARFGWRQITFRGPQVLLNGEQIILRGDSWHFMGIPQMTRRYPWAWFTALRSAGLNAVRLHAQPYPSFYLDVADELGVLVLDETAVWASDGGPKLNAPEFWQDTQRHLADLIRRDRNHPCVFGWSVCNEVMPIIRFIWRNPPGLMDELARNYGIWAEICRKLDPTRPWISADGDEDGAGKLPVFIVHYGGVEDMKRAVATNKPWGVGETGNAYYGSPVQVAETNGERAYESFEGRMEGVAMSSYQCLADEREHYATYRSVFNLVWYGLQPLPLGLRDTAKAPTLADGVVFSRQIEGMPGVQPERLGPYCTTLNPGYDLSLPLYEPWPLFDAIRDASAEPPVTGKWTRRPHPMTSPNTPVPRPVQSARVIAGAKSKLAAQLQSIGVPIDRLQSAARPDMLFVDGVNLPDGGSRGLIGEVLGSGGIVFVWGVDPDKLAWLNAWLPARLGVTRRASSSLLPGVPSRVTFGLKPSDLYFCEEQPSEIVSLGLGEPLIDQSSVLLKDCDTDWLKWNNQPEYAKTAMVIRSERESKPSGVVLAEKVVGGGRLLITTLSPNPRSIKAERINRVILQNLGLALNDGMDSGKPLLRTGVVVRVLACGYFPTSSASGSWKNEVPEICRGATFQSGSVLLGHKWQPVFKESGVFDITHIGLAGDERNATAFLSLWISSPYSLENLLLQPDLPLVDFQFVTQGSIEIWLNDAQVPDSQGEAGMTIAKGLKLRAGWNHLLVKLTRSTDRWEFKGSFSSTKPGFLSQMDSSLERP